MAKPSIPQGMRDFPAATVRKREYIFNHIRTVFSLYGFHPLETPAMENLETLMGKYGEEGDKLIFKVLNNGLSDPKNLEKAKEGFDKVLAGKNSTSVTERALKYDLTIPFARYVAMNHTQLTFPFKRYQIQQVWRADRPQKGRYREFTQCDADVVGSRSLNNEVALAGIYHDVFLRLGLTDYRISINNRKILAALADLCGGQEKLTDITIAIDKLDKTGIEKVNIELAERGLSGEQITSINSYLAISGSNEECIRKAEDLFGSNELARQGLSEIRYVLERSKGYNIYFDLTLARGLNYYTGIIFEAKAPEQVKIGSIGGGGRYDDLTGLFAVPNIPGVGISFGVDRIYDVMEELHLFPEGLSMGTPVMFLNLGNAEADRSLELMEKLRSRGIGCDLYHENAKFDKQFKYADKSGVSWCVIIGTKELDENSASVKELSTGHQETVNQAELISYLEQRIKK
jgi:histidyl-tRNA synthetase